MSIHPIAYDPNSQVYTMFDDDKQHQFDIVLSELNFVQGLQGANHLIIIIPCLVCGSVSSHPASGGADAPNIQQLFVNKTQSAGCVCGNVTAQSAESVAESHVRLNCNRLDGPGRWQIDSSTVNDLQFERAAEPVMFQTVSRKSDGLIIGLNAKGGVGPDNQMDTWHTQKDYDNLIRFDPAYVNADGDAIVGEPNVVSI